MNGSSELGNGDSDDSDDDNDPRGAYELRARGKRGSRLDPQGEKEMSVTSLRWREGQRRCLSTEYDRLRNNSKVEMYTRADDDDITTCTSSQDFQLNRTQQPGSRLPCTECSVGSLVDIVILGDGDAHSILPVLFTCIFGGHPGKVEKTT